MRWKWRLGFLVIAALEIPFVLWISTAMAAPPEILLYAGGILALVLMAMLLVRPLLFTFLIVWLGGVMGSAWYFVRFLPPTAALGVGRPCPRWCRQSARPSCPARSAWSSDNDSGFGTRGGRMGPAGIEPTISTL